MTVGNLSGDSPSDNSPYATHYISDSKTLRLRVRHIHGTSNLSGDRPGYIALALGLGGVRVVLGLILGGLFIVFGVTFFGASTPSSFEKFSLFLYAIIPSFALWLLFGRIMSRSFSKRTIAWALVGSGISSVLDLYAVYNIDSGWHYC